MDKKQMIELLEVCEQEAERLEEQLNNIRRKIKFVRSALNGN